MHEIISFEHEYITDALQLWAETDHLGVGDSDLVPDLDRFLDQNQRYSFVAKSGSNLIGTILVGQDGRRGYIYHLATLGSNRREGIASGLLNFALTALQDDKIRKCHAFVFRSNPYAELFWSKLGWVEREDLYVFSKTLVPVDA